MFRKFLLLLTVCSVIVCSAACSFGADPKIMRIASHTSTKSDSYDYICETMLNRLISEYTNGSIKVEYYPASQLGSSTELIEALAMGSIQSVSGIAYDLYIGIEPLCAITVMPYLFRNFEHYRAFLETPGSVIDEVNASLAKESDVLVLGYIYRAPRVTITKGKGIRKPDDFKGMVIRSPESASNVKWLEAMGASPVTIAWSELYTSLSQGAVEGAENSITMITDFGLQDIVDYCSETNHMMMSTVIPVNKTWFEALTQDEQNAIRKAAKEVTAYSWNAFREPINASWDAFRKAGVTCIRADEIDFDAFQKQSANVYKYFVKEGYFTEDQYNRILNMKY
ncbi:MAG: TRAP transporter substrate-binding protein [Synergistaceae bacterium]|nr:TRAP transporter substrate-binding protein [Synergistaceae bacterium]